MCGVGSCDADCELHDWSGWSDCSKACTTEHEAPAGRSLRRRAVRNPAIGAGTCAPAVSRLRLEARKCGAEACPSEVVCGSDQDVVVLLQGSDGANFSAQLAVAKFLLANSSEEVRYAIVAYGEKSEVLVGLSEPRITAITTLETSAQAPGGDADLAQAVAAAGGMLASQSGPLRKKVVLALSDGMPTTFGRTQTALRELAESGVRLVLGLADGYAGDARERACRLVGEPCAAFVEAVHAWSAMASDPTRFLAAVCGDGIVRAGSIAVPTEPPVYPR